MNRFIQVACIFAMLFLTVPAWHTYGADAHSPRRIEIDARRFSFQPSSVTLKRGEPVVLVLKSGDVAHGLRVRELGIDMKAAKGHTAEMTITPDKVGDFVGHCSTFCGAGHGSMTVNLHVEP